MKERKYKLKLKQEHTIGILNIQLSIYKFVCVCVCLSVCISLFWECRILFLKQILAVRQSSILMYIRKG